MMPRLKVVPWNLESRHCISRRDFVVYTTGGFLGACCGKTASVAKEITAPTEEDIVFDDFEHGYQKWKVTGTAFGTMPAKGTLTNQQNVTGFRGEYCINTFRDGDGTTGTAKSEPFTIEKPYITFLIGGGNIIDKLGLRLIVDGQVVERATGRTSELLEYTGWNVSRWKGRQAYFEIVDHATEGWGHTLVDDIVFTSRLPKVPLNHINHKYLVVPCYFDDTTDVRPHPLEYYQKLLGSQWPGVDHYFRTVSEGKVSISGTVVWDWTPLPGKAIDYAAAPNEEGRRGYDYKKLLEGLLKAYPRRVNLADWHGVAFAPNVVDQLGGGGATWVDANVAYKRVNYPVAILNPTQGQSVWVHEFSHHFQVGHLNKTSDGANDNPFSAMARWGPDYPPFGGIACDQIAFHKMQVGWLPAWRVYRLLAKGDSINTHLERLSAPTKSADPLVIILPVDETGKVYYTVEARRYSGVDKQQTIPCEGVVIHRIDENNRDREAVLQAHTSPFGKEAAYAWLPGEKFVDPTGRISIEVLRATATGFNVRCRITEGGAQP